MPTIVIIIVGSILLGLPMDDKEDLDQLLVKARARLQRKKIDEALVLANRAVELAPKDADIASALARCLKGKEARKYQEEGERLARANKELGRAIQASVKKPKDPELRRRVGALCLETGKDEQGLQWLLSALRVNGRHAATHQALADYYEGHGQPGLGAQHRQLALTSGEEK